MTSVASEAVGETKASPSVSSGSRVFLFLSAIILSLPLFIMPWGGLSAPVAKKIFISLALGVALLLALVRYVGVGKLPIPRSLIFYSSISLLVGVAILNFFSPSWRAGLLGSGFENNTVWSLLIGGLIMFLFSLNTSDRRSFVITYFALWGASFIAIALQVVRILAGSGLSVGFWPNAATNLVGKMNELGLLAGFFVVISVLPLEYLKDKLTLPIKVAIWFGILLASVVLVLANFAVLWWVTGAVCLAIFVAGFRGKVSSWKLSSFTKISFLLAIIFLVLATVHTFWGQRLYDGISTFNTNRGVQTLEVNPSWLGTLDVAQKVFTDSPLVGLGANNFSYGWAKYKSIQVNETLFWDVDFNIGVGTLPTLAVNSGIPGVLLVLFFVITIIVSAGRLIFLKNEDLFEKTSDLVAGWGGIFLLVMNIGYPTETLGMVLLFVWSGLIIARLHKNGLIKFFKLPVALNSSQGKLPLVVGIVAIVLSVVVLVISVANATSLIYLQSGAGLLGTDITKSEKRIERALFWRQSDLHYRVLAEVKLAKMNNLVATASLEEAENVTALQMMVDDSITTAKESVRINPTNYRNWLALAQVYEFLTSLGVDGAYDQAIASYGQAKTLVPTSPSVMLGLARLESGKNDLPKARTYIDEALRLKPNYPQAIFLLAQIEAAGGNFSAAISRAESLVSQFPNDPVVLFQLGYLQFQLDQYTSASDNFQKALNLDPNYADAAYFLGLTYDALGDTSASLGIFRRLLSVNPNNETLKQIVANLENGDRAMTSLTEEEVVEVEPLEEIEE